MDEARSEVKNKVDLDHSQRKKSISSVVARHWGIETKKFEWSTLNLPQVQILALVAITQVSLKAQPCGPKWERVPEEVWNSSGESVFKGWEEDSFKKRAWFIRSLCPRKRKPLKFGYHYLGWKRRRKSNDVILGDSRMDTTESFLFSLRDWALVARVVFGIELFWEEAITVPKSGAAFGIMWWNTSKTGPPSCSLKIQETYDLNIIDQRYDRTVNRNRFSSWAGSGWWTQSL